MSHINATKPTGLSTKGVPSVSTLCLERRGLQKQASTVYLAEDKQVKDRCANHATPRWNSTPPFLLTARALG